MRELAKIFRYVNLRHYRDHSGRVLLTVVGLAASVGMLIAISVINATLARSIQSETRGLAGSATLQVIPGGATPLPASTVAATTSTPGVQAAVPVLRVVSRIRHDHLSEPLLVFAVPGNLPALFPQGLGDVEQQLTTPSFNSGELTLTTQLASSLGVRVNELVNLQTPSGARSVRVGAILARNPFASLNGGVFALMALPAGQQLFGRTGEVSSIYVTAHAGVQRSTLRSALRHRLGTGVSVGLPGAEGQAYEQTFSTLAAVTEKARTIGLLVALFLVINTMAMAVAERREEIALLATAGAQRRQIFGAFLTEAGVLGLIGGVIGVIAGALLAHALVQRAVASYNVLPITVSGPLALESKTVLAGLAGGFYTSVIGAAIPARRILRVVPIDALRPEDSYEWATQRRKQVPTRLAVLGALAIGLSAVIAWRLPIGSNSAVFGVALILAFGGALLVMPLVMPFVARLLQWALRPMLGPSGKLGMDALLRAPGRTAITAGGIAVAAGFVIAVGSGIGSFRSATNEAAAQWYQAPLYINLEGATSYIVNQPLPVSVSHRLAAVKGVKALYPMRYGLINAHGHQTLVEAMPIAQAAAGGNYIMGSLGISRRALIRALGRGEVVISRLTARRYHLVPGELLPLPTTRGLVTIRIGGLFNDLASFDSVLVEHSVYERLSGDHQADRFAVVTRPGANTAVVKRELQHLLNTQGIAASVFTSGQMAEYLVKSIQGLFSVAQGIEAAALLVAALIVLSTMATATIERRQEFGIERALGMSRRQLGHAVIFEGTAMTVVGAIVAVALGLGLGLLITLSLENQLGWPVTFRPTATLTLGVVIIATVIGALAALYPAWLATRRTIMSLLRST
jgi:putative ABC transport system permease protein